MAGMGASGTWAIPTPHRLLHKLRNLCRCTALIRSGQQRLHQGDVNRASVLPDLEPKHASRSIARPRTLDACSACDSEQERDVYEACPPGPLQPRL